VSVLTFNFLSFGAWQNWWVAAQFLAFILVAGGEEPSGTTINLTEALRHLI